MEMLLLALQVIAGLVNLVCFLLVLYVMYDNSETTILIVCLVLLCVGGLGSLVAFIYGWTKAREWDIVRIMQIWTAGVVAGILVAVLRLALT